MMNDKDPSQDTSEETKPKETKPKETKPKESPIYLKQKDSANLYFKQGATIAIRIFGVSYKFSESIYRHTNKYMTTIPHDILNHYQAFRDDGSIDLTRMPDPSIVRPCSLLMDLFLQNPGKQHTNSIFSSIDPTPSSFTSMVFSYRMVYDILWFNRLATVEEDQVKHFLRNTTFMQFHRELLMAGELDDNKEID